MIKITATVVTALAVTAFLAQPEPFAFAGLSLKTTIAELKTRYPRSTAVGTLIHVSNEDSHDHVSTIGLSTDGKVRTLNITFERTLPGGTVAYPMCETLLALLKERYGNPAKLVDVQEEQARNRWFEWNTSAESMILRCFRMPRQPLYAERLTISSTR